MTRAGPAPPTTPLEQTFIDALDLQTALEALATSGPDLKVLAGGTDLIVQYLRGDIRPAGLLHVRRIPELRHRSLGERTVLGALTTHRELVAVEELRRRHPALAEAAATVGGRQTQNVGTIAGNVVNASPAADLIPVLLISDAHATLQSLTTSREIAVADFVLGRRSTRIRSDELVTGLSLEPLPPLAGETYVKVGRRAAMEVAVVGLAARLTFDNQGTVVDARIAAASVAPRAFRAELAERRLIGSSLDNAALAEAGQLLQAAAQPIDDARATAAYRRRVLPGLLTRAVAICRRRAFREGENAP